MKEPTNTGLRDGKFTESEKDELLSQIGQEGIQSVEAYTSWYCQERAILQKDETFVQQIARQRQRVRRITKLATELMTELQRGDDWFYDVRVLPTTSPEIDVTIEQLTKLLAATELTLDQLSKSGPKSPLDDMRLPAAVIALILQRDGVKVSSTRSGPFVGTLEHVLRAVGLGEGSAHSLAKRVLPIHKHKQLHQQAQEFWSWQCSQLITVRD